VSEAHREVPRARTNIRYDVLWFERQRLDNFMGLLPLVTRRIIELLSPLVRPLKAVMLGIVVSLCR
jgi:hypothetical protein